MSKGIITKTISLLLIAAMLLSLGVTAFAGEADGLGLTWPDTWQEGTPPDWALEATEKEQADTVAAITAEYDRQRENGFDMGTPQATVISAWGNMVGVQFNGGDNVGNPWGDTRKMGIIAAPYAGIAFSVKAYFGAHLGADTQPLANQFVYTDPADGSTKVYQVFTGSQAHHNTDGTAYEVDTLYPGSGAATAAIEDVFKYTYAAAAYGDLLDQAVTLGIAAADVKTTDNGIVYQEFFGSDSDGRSPQTNRGLDMAYGISYIVMPDRNGEKAYVVTDKMLTAWATTWSGLNSGEPDLFAATGAPQGNQYINNDGILCQDFENVTILLTDPDDPQNPTIVSSDCKLKNFSVGSNFVYAYDNKIEVYITDGSDITNLAPTFDLSPNAIATPASGEAHDFSRPVTYTVKSAGGQQESFTVTVENAAITDADRAACADFSSVYYTIGDEVSYYDKETIEGLIQRFNAMSIQCKYLLRDEVPKFTYIQSDFYEIYENPIKIAFIGDSITSGNSYANRIAAALKEAGLPFDARNFGVSGHCLSPKSDEPYTSTGRYLDSIEFEPDYVFFLLGTNDSKPRNWEGNRNVKNTFAQDLRDLVNIYRSLPSEPVVVIGTSPKSYDVELNKQVDSILNANIEKIVQIQKQVAAEMGCPLLDVNAFTQGHVEWFPDAVHPSDAGHNALRDFYLDYLYDLMNADLTGITVNGRTVTGFNAGQRSYIVDADIVGAQIKATTGNAQKDANITTKLVVEGAETRYAAITVNSPLKYFSKTYVVNFTGDVAHTDADAAAAKAVDDRIAALGQITTLAQEQAVVDAREAYEALTLTQKSLVVNMTVLKAAESAIQTLKDQQVASAVEALIDVLPAAKDVTLANQTAIQTAQAEYDKLTKEQKAMIPAAKTEKLNAVLAVLNDLLNPYVKYEAEAGAISGGAGIVDAVDCSGGQYVGSVGNNSGKVEITVNMAHAATTEMVIWYATGADRSLQYTVNGETKTVNCQNSGDWSAPADVRVTVYLKAGENVITFENATGWAPNLDCIEVAKATEETKTAAANAVAQTIVQLLPDQVTEANLADAKTAVTAAEAELTQLSAEQKQIIADTLARIEAVKQAIDNIENPKPVVLKGDLNADGRVTASDFTPLKTIILSNAVPTDEQLAAGDLNGDGKISVVDIIAVKRIILG